MKRLMILTALLPTVSTAHASTFNCELKTKGGAVVAAYTFDTKTGENKFVSLPSGDNVGCVVLRSQPELISCGVGSDPAYSVFATAASDTAVLALDAKADGNEANLTCVRTP